MHSGDGHFLACIPAAILYSTCTSSCTAPDTGWLMKRERIQMLFVSLVGERVSTAAVATFLSTIPYATHLPFDIVSSRRVDPDTSLTGPLGYRTAQLRSLHVVVSIRSSFPDLQGQIAFERGIRAFQERSVGPRNSRRVPFRSSVGQSSVLRTANPRAAINQARKTVHGRRLKHLQDFRLLVIRPNNAIKARRRWLPLSLDLSAFATSYPDTSTNEQRKGRSKNGFE